MTKRCILFFYIDQRYLDTYDITLLAGKNFTAAQCERPPEEVTQVMVNEKAALELGFSSAPEAVGQTILYDGEREIIGVVKDYNHQSLQQQIDPIIFVPRNNATFFTVRLTTDQIQTKVSELEAQFKQAFPGNPFEFFFADDFYNQQYQAEQQYQRVFTAASCLAIFIACLGLFGIAAFTAQQRVKEIGIRKVLGASVAQHRGAALPRLSRPGAGGQPVCLAPGVVGGAALATGLCLSGSNRLVDFRRGQWSRAADCHLYHQRSSRQSRAGQSGG